MLIDTVCDLDCCCCVIIYNKLVALYRLLLQVHLELEVEMGGQSGGDIWYEFVSDLWEKYLPHLREELFGEGLFVFDPSTECYGFQENEEDEEEGSGGFMAALMRDAMEEGGEVGEEGSFKIQDPLDSFTEETECPIGNLNPLTSDKEGVTEMLDLVKSHMEKDPKLKQQFLSIVQRDGETLCI